VWTGVTVIGTIRSLLAAVSEGRIRRGVRELLPPAAERVKMTISGFENLEPSRQQFGPRLPGPVLADG
jgi:hypothetical protein